MEKRQLIMHYVRFESRENTVKKQNGSISNLVLVRMTELVNFFESFQIQFSLWPKKILCS